MGNYSFKTTGLPEPVNGVVEGHNFTQGAPHTAIYTGQTGLTFRNCNLLNCDVPAGSVVEFCNRGHVSFCSHLHDSWLAHARISACAESCTHIIHADAIIIDGVAVDTNYYREDKVVE